MEENPTRVCELLIGLGDVEVLGVDDAPGAPLGVHIATRASRPACGGCGGSVWSKGSAPVGLVDLVPGHTLARWHTQIVNWHHARVSNGPTEAINNLIKRVKRAAFGFRRFAHYRIRALLYAGKPNWTLLNSLTPR